jgi:hypothetical protein
MSGAGNISTSGSVTNINQASRNLLLNWSTFNIAPSETVNFIQPKSGQTPSLNVRPRAAIRISYVMLLMSRRAPRLCRMPMGVPPACDMHFFFG